MTTNICCFLCNKITYNRCEVDVRDLRRLLLGKVLHRVQRLGKNAACSNHVGVTNAVR
jgi:hypothetical protein